MGPYGILVTASSALVKTGPGILHAITLTGGSNAATVTLYNNTEASGPQAYPIIKTPLGDTVHVEIPGGVPFGTGLYAEITGTTPDVGIVFE